MKIKRIIDREYTGNCYILYFNKKCAIIDPCVSIEEIEEAINGYELVCAILTHGHADHFGSLEEVVNKYNVLVYAHKSICKLLENPEYNYSIEFNNPLICILPRDKYKFVEDEELLNIEEYTLKFMYTPGHTECSICILMDDYMFTGDTLFKDAFGRYDLPTGSFLEMRKSLKKLSQLQKDYIIMPGHGDSSSLKKEIKKYVK